MKSYNNFILFSVLEKLNYAKNFPLESFTTLRVGGPARFFAEINSAEELKLIQNSCFEHGISTHILSGGSNTLISDEGFNGLVIKLGPKFDFINSLNQQNLVIGSATSLAKTCKLALSLGWKHALGWAGIPGLIGGAIFMNAGTRSGEIKDALVRIYGVHQGEYKIIEKQDLNFQYRKSNLPKNFIITQIELFCEKNLLENPEFLKNKFKEYQIKRKTTQPLVNSAGSFFKNPYPNFAAQLIEKCNLKGLEYNGAQISPIHANFIVNKGGARAQDIIHVASIAKKQVFNQFGIKITPEICMVGEFNQLLQKIT